MPRKCSVAGCTSNYRNEKKYVTTYALPTNEELRKKWLRKIPTNFTGIKEPAVCINHFSESDIIRNDVCFVKGERKEYRRKIPKLKDNVVPSIFYNVPKYLSSTANTSKRLCDVEQENFERAILDSVEMQKNYENKQQINTLDDVLLYYEKSKINKDWILICQNEKVYLCFLSLSQVIPKILGSVVIDRNLVYTVIINNESVPSKNIPNKLNNLNCISVLEEILKFVECGVKHPNDECKIKKINEILSEISVSKPEENAQLSFIIEQLNFSKQPSNNRRYGGKTLLIAATLYVQSSATYMALYESKCLYVPHPRNIKKLVSKFSLTDSSLKGSIEYLKSELSFLEEHEFVVNLHLDEIYINPELNFKTNTIFGVSETDPMKIAKTVQVFMISSILSKYKDVISLIPVNNLTADQFKQLILNVLKEIENLGFKVIALISDNNSVNRKAFGMFAENNLLQPSVPHPLDNSRQLFLIFDVVHIIKSIRNNWIRKKTECCTLQFPEFNVDKNAVIQNKMQIAEFKHLQTLYETEKNSLIKYGHLLSYKTLYPTSIQKQNVKLALNIFNEKNVAALKCISKDKLDFGNIDGTCSFLEIFIKWWKIVNVKSVYEGQRFNDPYREPIRRESSMQIEFLKNMSNWLKIWRASVPVMQSLSSETLTSLINTTDAFLQLIPYMFRNYRIDYILLSKFENDVLEGRFGYYRQLSGANYYISFLQLLESERKIRFKSAVLFSCDNNEISLKTILPNSNDTYKNNVDINPFCSVLCDDFCLEKISKDNLTVLTYISGYAVAKQLRLKQCLVCSDWLLSNTEIEVDIPHDLTLELDRGKLILPSELALIPVAVAWHILQKICDEFLNLFLVSTQHLSVLHKLCLITMNNYNNDYYEFDFAESCNCKDSLQNRLQQINLTACRIMLSNFVKKQNDLSAKSIKCNSSSSDLDRKIKKLKR